jgi:AraC-like DNA-binding protein
LTPNGKNLAKGDIRAALRRQHKNEIHSMFLTSGLFMSGGMAMLINCKQRWSRAPMTDERKPETTTADSGVNVTGANEQLDKGAAMVRADALRKFPEVVTQLGGDPRSLLAKVQIDPAILNNRHAVIPYRSLVQVLERASIELACPDFGMRLAAAQGGIKVLGPLEYAMRNSHTMREAFRYCADHIQVYSTASRMKFEEGLAPDSLFTKFDILLARLPSHCQIVERALLLTQHTALTISSGRVRAHEVWFAHQPLSSPAVYSQYFGATVRFGQSMDGLFFSHKDLDAPIPNVDSQIYALTKDFIEHRFPSVDSVLSNQVRTIVERRLLEGDCTYSSAAAMLGMHPRTLQRRLRAEGVTFETIKDGVRRDVALRYLQNSSLPLIRVANILGYSETSALSRSCYRWFSASPRQLRAGAVATPNDSLTKESTRRQA